MNNVTLILALSVLISLSPTGRDSFNGRERDLRLSRFSSAEASAPVSDTAAIDADKVFIRDAWIQEGPPSQKITVAFMLIENRNASEISLLSATTDAARVVELHRMLNEDGMMRMQKVDSISVPAGAVVRLEPGGYHLMVIDLKRELKAGTQVRVTLRFSNHIEKTISVPVKNRESMTEEGEANR